MTDPERIPPDEARKRVLIGAALLVCAYDDEEKFKKMHLEGGIPYAEFQKMASSLSRDREIIFF